MKKIILLSLLPLFSLTSISHAEIVHGQSHADAIGIATGDDNAGPAVGQLQPVSQINLRPGYHLLDAQLNYTQWIGDLTGEPYYQLPAIQNAKSQETQAKINYAYGLFRHTYIGANLGFTQRHEADYNSDQGPLDPEFFIGQHFPWANGNFRLGINASPSLGIKTKTMKLTNDSQSVSGNAFRGGYKIKPEAAVYFRAGPLIIGTEASYTILGARVVETENDLSMAANPTNGYSYNYNNGYGNNNGYSNNNTIYDPNYNNISLSPNMGLPSAGTKLRQTISGGDRLGLKMIIEIPKFERLGAEWLFEQVQPQNISVDNQYWNGNQSQSNINAYNQNQVKLYARYKLSSQMSLIPEVTWVQAPPDGVLATNNNQNMWAFGCTYRTKFN